MELKVTELQQPGKISFNYEELKAELAARVHDYETMVYTDDQIAIAKKDRAALNKLKKALNDERIRQEREFMAPFEEFKGQVKELCAIIDKASSAVDGQVKAYEEQQKAQKAEAIKALWDKRDTPEWMRISDPRWLNASVRLDAIEAAIVTHLVTVQNDIDTLDGMGACFEAMKMYQATLDLNASIAENTRIKAQEEAKAKWEAEHAQLQVQDENKPEQVESVPVPEPEKVCVPSDSHREWIAFDAYLSAEEAKALGQFLKVNKIKYRKHQEE